MSRLRLGVIGAGAWTRAVHLPNLQRHRDEVEFIAVNRRDPDRLEEIRRTFGFESASTDYRDVLDRGIDICVVGSPAGLHHEHARAALDAGAHVLVEKPFTIDPVDAWDLVDAAERHDRHLIVAFGANYQPMIVEAHRLMTSGGGVGDVEHVAIHMASPLRAQLRGSPSRIGVAGSDGDVPELLPNADTHADPALSGGGYAAAQLSHALGLGLWLTSLRGRSVYAVTWAPNEPGHDRALDFHDAAVITYDNGAIGTLSGGSSHWGANGNKHQQEVRVIGSQGQLHVDVEREIVWRYRGDGDDVRIPLKPGDGTYECLGPTDALVALASGQPAVNASPGWLGARVVEVVDAVYRSARSGAPAHINHPTHARSNT